MEKMVWLELWEHLERTVDLVIREILVSEEELVILEMTV